MRMAPNPYQENSNILENDENVEHDENDVINFHNDVINFHGSTFYTLGSTNMRMAAPRPYAKSIRKSSEMSEDYHIFDGYKTILLSKPSGK